MKRTTMLALMVLLPVLVLRGSQASAQGSARSMDLDISIRSAGMGGASNAVLWGGGVNHWGNPALLGAERGIRWEWGRTQLVPDLATDVIFETQVVKIGGGGAGVVSSGTPFGPGVHLGYGTSESTDSGGNPTGTFSPYEQVDSWGFGVSVFEVLENIAQARHDGRGPLSRYVDVAFGMNFKDVEVNLAPGFGAGTSARDCGATVRVTPVDLLTEAGTPIRLDASFGVSVLSANDDAQLTFFVQTSPVSRHRRNGAALHFAADPGAGRPANRSAWSWLHEGLSPMLSLGIASDRSKITAGSGVDERSTYETDGAGVEVAIANILWGRAGQYTDRTGGIEGSTRGWGVQLPLGRVAGIRYDGAMFPQSTGLDHVVRHGVSAWLDPFALIRALERRGGASI